VAMCNLYSLNKKRDAVARFFRVSHNRSPMFKPASVVFPRNIAPVIRETADGEREIVMMDLPRFGGEVRIFIQGI